MDVSAARPYCSETNGRKQKKKILFTIHSRVLVTHLKNLTVNTIRGYLETILKILLYTCSLLLPFPTQICLFVDLEKAQEKKIGKEEKSLKLSSSYTRGRKRKRGRKNKLQSQGKTVYRTQ